MLLLKIKKFFTSKGAYIASVGVASSKCVSSELASETMTLLKSEYVLGCFYLPPEVLSLPYDYGGWTFPFFLCDGS